MPEHVEDVGRGLLDDIEASVAWIELKHTQRGEPAPDRPDTGRTNGPTSLERARSPAQYGNWHANRTGDSQENQLVVLQMERIENA
ncbi:hypothetical protein BZM26_30755 [Paraburkholderia strydomiana]|nr:hypothetical protein BZM26_30755 [Paraburkholderia strydomiana]